MSASDPNLAIAFHHAPMGVVVAQPDGVIIACNPAAGQLGTIYCIQGIRKTFYVTPPRTYGLELRYKFF